MRWLDLVLLVLLVLSILGGYRRGAVLQVIGLLGLAAGVVVGASLAPRAARLGSDPMTHVAFALGAVVVGGAVGNLAGWLAGSRLRARTRETKLRTADAFVGSLVSVLALLLTTWFVSLNLANGPFPGLARGIHSSRIVRGIDAVMPAPPSMLGEVQRVLSLLGFPEVFVGLPPAPADPVPPPPQGGVRRAYRAAKDGTVKILGRGCASGFLNEGSGFVARHELVVTNAHVVAGTTSQWIDAGDVSLTAHVVLFDPDLDVAVLRVPGLSAAPLSLVLGEVERGDGGAVLGFPDGGPLTGGAAAVRQAIEAVGRDIYGRGEVQRRLYEIQARIRQGNSGGPFVLPDGRVAGVVFASSVVNEDVGYAIASTEVAPLVRQGAARTGLAGTGACAG